MRQPTDSPLVAYGVAVASIAAAIALRLVLDPILGTRFPYATLFLAVLVSAWFGGLGPAVCASLIGAVASTWFLVEPRYRLVIDDLEGWGGLALYLAVSLGIAALGGAMRRARDAAHAQKSDTQAQREQLRVTLQSIGDGVITTDRRGRITSLNAVAAELTGWAADEALGQPLERVFQIVHESTREKTPNPAQRALAEGRVVGLTNHTLLIRRDGTERAIDDSAAPIRDTNGAVNGVVLVFRDVTDRRSMEAARTLLVEVVESSEDAIITKTLEGVITTWNKGAERIFGYSRDEMIGTSIHRIVPADRADDVSEILAAIGRGERVDHFESERVCKDGRRINVSLSVSPIRDHDGTIVGAAKIARDVTLQRRADVERQATVRRLGTLYAVGQAVAAELDRERVLQTITDAARDLSGAKFGAFFHNVADPESGHYLLYTLSGAPRADFERFGAPRNTAVFAPTFAGEGVVRVADIRKDPRYGHNRPHHGTPVGHLPVTSYLAVPVTSRTGEVFGGLFLGHPDAGMFDEEAERVVVALASQASIALENTRLYEAEQRARADAEQASQEKDHFLAMLGHELRNPLSAVCNGLTASRLDPARAERALDIARHAAGQLTRLVDDLLDVTRVTQGRLLMRTKPFDLAAVVERAVDTVRSAFDERGVVLTFSRPDEACVVDGDEVRIEQVVGNLLVNAAKYTDSGGGVAVTLERHGDSMVLRVADTGVGIEADVLPRIFDLFVQAEQSLDRSRGGLGIGLTLVKKIVELHDGRVEAFSDGPGRGAEFVVTLPAAVGATLPAAPAAGVPTAIGPASVIVVEDNADAAESLMLLLELMGLQVRVAGNGNVALAEARTRRPDVMLVDIGLPGMNGYQLARAIRSDPALAGIMLVALTGYGQEDDRRQALLAGFDHHLVKPVEVDHIQRLLAELSAANAAVS